MAIVDRIKQRCKEMNTSMNALEKELGLGNGTIRLWDVKDPGSSKVILVANRLGCSLDWILTGKEAAELTPEEQELVDLYRRSNVTGKKLILNNAKTTSETLPAELKSSASQIG